MYVCMCACVYVCAHVCVRVKIGWGKIEGGGGRLVSFDRLATQLDGLMEDEH